MPASAIRGLCWFLISALLSAIGGCYRTVREPRDHAVTVTTDPPHGLLELRTPTSEVPLGVAPASFEVEYEADVHHFSRVSWLAPVLGAGLSGLSVWGLTEFHDSGPTLDDIDEGFGLLVLTLASAGLLVGGLIYCMEGESMAPPYDPAVYPRTVVLVDFQDGPPGRAILQGPQEGSVVVASGRTRIVGHAPADLVVQVLADPAQIPEQDRADVEDALIQALADKTRMSIASASPGWLKPTVTARLSRDGSTCRLRADWSDLELEGPPGKVVYSECTRDMLQLAAERVADAIGDSVRSEAAED